MVFNEQDREKIRVIVTKYQKENPDLLALAHHDLSATTTQASDYAKLVLQMGQTSDLLATKPYDTSVGRYFGLKNRLKNLILRISRPIIRISLGNQEAFNSNAVMLAQAVVALEDRVRELEAKLQAPRN